MKSATDLTVWVWRGTDKGRYQRYAVPRQDNQTVLDVVTWIQRHLEPALAYRFACRVGMCGSCAMTVNGRPRWTCRTHVESVADKDTLKLAPLRNLPVIRDLACDLDPFFEKWQRSRGRFVGTATRAEPPATVAPQSAERQAADHAIECINCAVCYAACDTVAWDDAYVGPAALNRAWSLLNDVRDGDHAGLTRAVADTGGCITCHGHGSCSAHCPMELEPAMAVASLKRHVLGGLFKGRA